MNPGLHRYNDEVVLRSVDAKAAAALATLGFVNLSKMAGIGGEAIFMDKPTLSEWSELCKMLSTGAGPLSSTMRRIVSWAYPTTSKELSKRETYDAGLTID